MKKIIPVFLLFLCITLPIGWSQDQKDNLSPWIHVNHFGYLPSSDKIAVVSSVTGLPFELIQLLPEPNQKKTVLKGMLKLTQANDPLSGAHVWEADFSSIHAAGTYQISVSGIGNSYPFQIMPRLYNQLSAQALKSFYFHRSGVELPQKFAVDWNRPPLQDQNAVLFNDTESSGQVRTVTGGWYDGSDTGRYVTSGAFAAGLLLQLYEMKPHLFEDGAVGIPEFRNGVPDVLDEAKWELEWLLKMQRDDGGVYHKLTAKEPDYTPSKNGLETPYYLLPVSTNATASTCALLAKAGRVFQPFSPEFAAQCLDASIAAWDYLLQHPDPFVFENPSGFQTKSYSDSDDSDERIWAAVELFISTNEPQYYTALQLLTEKRVPLLSSAGYWGQVMPLAAGSMILHSTPFQETKILDEIMEDLNAMSDTIVEKIRQSGFRVSLESSEMIWGSNGALLQNALILLTAQRVNPKPEYITCALDQLHYVLGRNPLSICYVTGNGQVSPEKPFHFYHQIKKDTQPVPGMLVAGPNKTLSDSVVKKSFTSGTPPALIYRDDVESFSTNETAITWNAVLTYISAWMDDVP